MHSTEVYRRLLSVGALFVAAGLGLSQPNSDLRTLYDRHRWKDLYAALQNATGNPLYRSAIGVTYNQKPGQTEQLLLSVIKADAKSMEAYDATEWLSHFYFYRGRYQSLISIMELRWKNFPDKKEKSQEQTALEGFRNLPNQVTESSRPSTVRHEPASTFIPLAIDGTPATYFFDTGAWVRA